MTWLVVIVMIIVLCFGLVVLVGAPYLPTLKPQLQISLDLLDLKPGQTMLELGCGDGRVLVAAAQRGWRVVGYELNPLLALFAYIRTRKYGKLVSVKCANFWTTTWPVTDGIFGFILPKYMAKLDKKVVRDCQKPVRVASFAFAIPGRKPTKTTGSVFLYEYR